MPIFSPAPPRPAPIAAAALLLCAFSPSSLHPPLAQAHRPADPDAQIVTAPGVVTPEKPAPDSPTSATAWSTLTDAVNDTRHVDMRIQALAALGTLAGQPRAEQLIGHSMHDPDLDVRTAAILAAGQTGAHSLTFELRSALDDPEPQVAFVAATTLWKLGDRSGEDILRAVLEGERSASPTLIRGARQSVLRDLHNPATLARLGALQGAAFLLGPFGFGITAVEYMLKNGGDAARVEAISLIAQAKSTPIRDELIAALCDKDPAVRAAAARALGQYRDPVAAQALVPVFNDPKAPVRLTVAAAFLNASQPPPRPAKNKR